MQLVEGKLKEAELAYKMKADQVQGAKETFEVCRRRLAIRRDKYAAGLHALTSELAASFEKHLSGVIRRSAHMLVNHETRSVRLVTSDESQSANAQTKTLSGGEKSAVQLAFLIALAKQSVSPLHIFDEVDVFMDEGSRIKKCVLSPRKRMRFPVDSAVAPSALTSGRFPSLFHRRSAFSRLFSSSSPVPLCVAAARTLSTRLREVDAASFLVSSCYE
ncbi:putative ABC-SMC-head domain protein [Toxoplasma gondii RUB]|uniref:Putative ABC-SMC-head domain protein n=1 Tax=Toxoplasma gondii RUB TaxID=935652 RepID=A0A086LMB8_TOXGO|nr:putative ABC-SMC-head domain protein [Toxoplasma gondii RUB]